MSELFCGTGVKRPLRTRLLNHWLSSCLKSRSENVLLSLINPSNFPIMSVLCFKRTTWSQHNPRYIRWIWKWICGFERHKNYSHYLLINSAICIIRVRQVSVGKLFLLSSRCAKRTMGNNCVIFSSPVLISSLWIDTNDGGSVASGRLRCLSDSYSCYCNVMYIIQLLQVYLVVQSSSSFAWTGLSCWWIMLAPGNAVAERKFLSMSVERSPSAGL